MLEPSALSISAPTSEPTLRIGIILANDNQSIVDLSARGDSYQMTIGHEQIDLKDGQDVSIEAISNGLARATIGNKSWSGPQLIVAPSKLHEGDDTQNYLTVKNVPTGRGFHWQHSLTQRFAGSFEVHVRGKSLLLVNLLPLEKYIASVVTSEMSAECPLEFIKAQSIAARSWATVFLKNKHQNEPYTICNDDDCQRYQGLTNISTPSLSAVNQTRGQFLVVDDSHKVAAAYFSKCCGDHTDSSEDVFGVKNSGCSAVSDTDSAGRAFCSPHYVNDPGKYLGSVDLSLSYYDWTATISAVQIIENLQNKFGCSDLVKITKIVELVRSKFGRLLSIQIYYLNSKGIENSLCLTDQYDLRNALHPQFLFSSKIDIETIQAPDSTISELNIRGKGWGHGVGLCQIGAVGMALTHHAYDKILNHYYPACHIVKGYE